MSTTFTLSRPIVHGSEEITELEFREPTTKDVNTLGMPFKLNADLISEPIPAVTAKYISRLASIPPSVVEKIDVMDYMKLLYLVMGFFTHSTDAQQKS